MKTKTITAILLTLFLTSMLAFNITPAKAQYVVDEYTVGLWHFNKEFGTALDFDTNDYVAVPDSASLEPMYITVEAWVKRLGSPGNYRYIVSKHYGSGWNSYGLYTNGTGGLWFYIGTETRYCLSPDAGTGVWDGSWHHIAGTFDGSYVRLYVDGNEVGAGTPVPSGTSIAYDGAGINIGGPGDPWLGGPYHFEGVIDEVRISNRARTSFNLSTPLTADIYAVALWHFDEGSGQSAYDATGNGNDGELGSTSGTDDNDPTWVDSTLAIDSSSNGNFGTIHGATWVDGKYNVALEFDGVDDYVEIPHTTSLDITEQLTVEAWINLDTVNPAQALGGTIIRKGAWPIVDPPPTWGFDIQFGKLRAFIYDDGSPYIANGATVLSAGVWYHVAFTYDGSEVQIYLNGVSDGAPTPHTGNIDSASAPVWIGRKDQAAFFDGIIDEVRISNVARVPVDIDIKPGSDPNSICLKDSGLLPVAILSTEAFDATQINLDSLLLGGVGVSSRGSRKAPKIAYSIEDVNGDGYPDMMAFFSVPELVDTGLTLTTTMLELTAILTDGTHITGIDSVRIVPP